LSSSRCASVAHTGRPRTGARARARQRLPLAPARTPPPRLCGRAQPQHNATPPHHAPPNARDSRHTAQMQHPPPPPLTHTHTHTHAPSTGGFQVCGAASWC
jgi:hypothetical protein